MIISFKLDNVYSKFPLRPPFVTDTDRLQCIWSYLRESIARKNLFGTEDRWSFYRVVLLSSGLISRVVLLSSGLIIEWSCVNVAWTDTEFNASMYMTIHLYQYV